MSPDDYYGALRTVFSFLTDLKAAFKKLVNNISVMDYLAEHNEFSVIRTLCDSILRCRYSILNSEAETG